MYGDLSTILDIHGNPSNIREMLKEMMKVEWSARISYIAEGPLYMSNILEGFLRISHIVEGFQYVLNIVEGSPYISHIVERSIYI